MSDREPSADLVLTWIAATDLQGRTRLEARWTETPHTNAPAGVTHAA